MVNRLSSTICRFIRNFRRIRIKKKIINLPNLDPMTHALLYPNDESVCQPNWEFETYEVAKLNFMRTKIRMLQLKIAQIAIGYYFNPIMNSGKLTQQWIVDFYLQVEVRNLKFGRHQKKISNWAISRADHA